MESFKSYWTHCFGKDLPLFLTKKNVFFQIIFFFYLKEKIVLWSKTTVNPYQKKSINRKKSPNRVMDPTPPLFSF